MKKFLVLAAAMATSFSALAFQATDTAPMVSAEVQQRKLKGESMSVIMAAAKLAVVKADVLAAALVDAGYSAEDVVRAMVTAGFDAKLVVDGASRKGANREALQIVAETSSPQDNNLSANNLGGNNFNGSNFNSTRNSTVGGNGRSSVSPS